MFDNSALEPYPSQEGHQSQDAQRLPVARALFQEEAGDDAPMEAFLNTMEDQVW